MEENTVYYSPVICYEIIPEKNSYHIKVYLNGCQGSKNNELCCELRDFTEDKAKAEAFAEHLAKNAALPIHIPELAEEFLSV